MLQVVHDICAVIDSAGLLCLGNGMIDSFAQMISGYDILCTGASLSPPIFSISSCVRMQQVIPRCKKWLKEACVDSLDYMSCEAAHDWCSNELGRNQEPEAELMAMGELSPR